MYQVLINPKKKIGKVNEMIFGNFIENLDKCIYGGVYDPISSVADEDGFRTDVIEATKQMGISNVRFPGGCYAPFYHFYNGIGEKEKRPKTRYKQYNPSNEFGTDEFLIWCQKVNVEPFICVNMGSGTAEEAMNWVEYCNGEAGSYWADKRISNGHSKPYNVKYWAIGNEIGGTWEYGHSASPEEYIQKARDYVKVMKYADPSIKLVLCGAHFPIDFISDDWNRKVLDALYDYVDYINIHHYIGHDYKDEIWNTWDSMGALEVHYHLHEYMQLLEDALHMIQEDIRFINHKKNTFKEIGIALDEYNPWYREEENSFVPFNVSDSLLVASYFNIFIRNAEAVTLCNMAQLVNTIPAMVCKSGSSEFFRQGTSYVQEIFLKNKGMQAVDVWCESPRYQGSYYPEVPYLDLSASIDEERNTVILNIVNRNHEEAYDVELNIFGKEIIDINAQIFRGNNIEDRNSFENPSKVSIQKIVINDLKISKVQPMSLYTFELRYK